MKPATRATVALAATGVAYATAYTTVKTLGEAFEPTRQTVQEADAFIRNTDGGLLIQTAAIMSSANLAGRFFRSDFGKTVVPKSLQFRGNKDQRILQSAATGFAVGRLLTGLATKDVGGRFQAAFDGDLPGALSRTPGPYLNRPSNVKSWSNVMSNNGVVNSNYYNNVYQPKLDMILANNNANARNNNNAAINQSINQTPNGGNGLPNGVGQGNV